MLLNSLFHPKSTLFEFISFKTIFKTLNKVFSLFCVFVCFCHYWWMMMVVGFVLVWYINVFCKGFWWENYIGWNFTLMCRKSNCPGSKYTAIKLSKGILKPFLPFPTNCPVWYPLLRQLFNRRNNHFTEIFSISSNIFCSKT